MTFIHKTVERRQKEKRSCFGCLKLEIKRGRGNDLSGLFRILTAADMQPERQTC